MGRKRNKKIGAKVWLAAFAMVLGLFALTDDEQAAAELLSTLLKPPANDARALSGTASVIDGDTIEIHGTRIRLHAIDAPESRQTCLIGKEEWRCGQQASLALADRIDRRPVTCEEKDIDRYGRVVAACFAGGESLNAWMVHEGWAVAYRQYGRDYIAEETAAKAARRGVWAGTFMMPWEWRRK